MNYEVNGLQEKLNAKDLAPVLGMTIKDKVSGIEGVINAVRVLLSGCEHFLIQRPGLNTQGEPYAGIWLSAMGVENYDQLPRTTKPEILGARVRDRVTEYEGIVTEVTLMDGYDLVVHIQSGKLRKDGRPALPYGCDLSRVDRVDAKKILQTGATGAPAMLARAVDRSRP